VPRREHDAALAEEHERVAELARENRALREHIRAQASERQAVIERYERLLDRRETAGRPPSGATTPASESSAPSPAPAPGPSGVTGRARAAVDAARSALSDLRGRIAGRLARD
jgi:hypothetical protein